MTTEIATYLKYANLQMAAEALYGLQSASPGQTYSGAISAGILTSGNNRSSKFTAVQADEFSNNWTVVEHKSNTSTGFSGTLFKYTGQTDAAKGLIQNELVLSFRSTEFNDDAARDNEATNSLEIRPYGWAFGQIDDMEKWYQSLRTTYASDFASAGGKFAVTGYSLGGHLATAFDWLRVEDSTFNSSVSGTYTFNGAGVGKLKAGNTLNQVITEFRSRRATGANNDLFTDNGAKAAYTTLKTKYDGTVGETILPLLDADLASLATQISGIDKNANPNGYAQFQLLQDALKRLKGIAAEAKRVTDLPSGGAAGTNAKGVAFEKIAATALDYQLAVLTVGPKRTLSYGDADAAKKTFGYLPRDTLNMASVTDIYGDTGLSMVSNSQMHFGASTPIWIEDQPERRGSVTFEVLKNAIDGGGLKLLVENFSRNDFGDTHSLVLLIDSLGVQNTFAQLVPAMKPSDFTPLMKIASNAKVESGVGTDSQGTSDGNTLEKMVNALGSYLGTDKLAGWVKLKGDPNGNTWALTDYTGQPNPNGYTTRVDLHKNLALLANDDFYKALIGKLVITPASGSLGSNAIARTSFSDTLALQTLSPFVLKGIGDEGKAGLEAIWQSNRWNATYQDWLADKAAINAGGKATNFTDKWLTDRAQLLSAISVQNKNNSDTGWVFDTSVPADRILDFRYTDPAKPGESALLAKPLKSTGLDYQKIVFGDDGNNTLTGSSSKFEDRLYGGAGNDTLEGKGGDDYLEGGKDTDTYVFSGGFGKDTIVDSDGNGKLTFGGVKLDGGKFEGVAGAWVQKINGDTILYKLIDSSQSSTGKQLIISKQGDNTNSITVNNFDFTKAADTTPGSTGYLGIKLDSTRKLAVTETTGTNFWTDPLATLASLVGKVTTITEGTGKAFTIALNMGAKAGDTITLAMGGAGDKFEVILGDSRVPANGAVITLTEGQTEVRISLVENAPLSADASANLSATYKSVDPADTQTITSNTWGIEAKDNGEASKTFIGDQRGKRIGVETLLNFTPSDPAYNHFDWSATTWTADGTLTGGIAEADYNDVITGTTTADKISGQGGNDALSGGEGNDQIEGGDGDDLIGGGLGSDSIKGGAGNDYIYSAIDLNVALRTKADEQWELPVGATLKTKGSNWGIATTTDGQSTVNTYLQTGAADNAPDFIDAGDGDDTVIAGRGNDMVQGGEGTGVSVRQKRTADRTCHKPFRGLHRKANTTKSIAEYAYSTRATVPFCIKALPLQVPSRALISPRMGIKALRINFDQRPLRLTKPC